MNKTLVALVLILTLVLCFASCGSKSPSESTPPVTTPSVTTPSVTTPPATTLPPIDPSEYFDHYIGFPYLKTEISQYATIPASAYAALMLTMDATDKDVDDYIADLLAEYPIEILVDDRPVKEGDLIYLYFEGSIDGELFANGSNMEDEKPFPLEIGSGSFIPGFEEQLIGMIPSETETTETYIDVTFPDDYDPSLAGKNARFEIYIVSIVDGYEDRTELTAEFLTEIGFETEESDVIAAFRAELFSELRKQIVSDYDAILRERLLELVLPSLSVVRLPETEVARQAALITEEIEAYFEYYGYYYDIESLDEFAVLWLGLEDGADWRAEVESLAADNVRYKFLLYAIAENEGLSVSEDRFIELLEELSDEYGMEESEIIRLAGADIVYDEVISRAVTELLISRATIDNGELPLEDD